MTSICPTCPNLPRLPDMVRRQKSLRSHRLSALQKLILLNCCVWWDENKSSLEGAGLAHEWGAKHGFIFYDTLLESIPSHVDTETNAFRAKFSRSLRRLEERGLLERRGLDNSTLATAFRGRTKVVFLTQQADALLDELLEWVAEEGPTIRLYPLKPGLAYTVNKQDSLTVQTGAES